MWTSGRFDYIVLSNIVSRNVKGEYFPQETEICKILVGVLDKELEKLDDHGCPKVQDLVDEGM